MGLFDLIEDIVEDAGKHLENTVDLITGQKDLQDFIEDGIHVPLDRAEEWVDNWEPTDDVDKFASSLRIKQDYFPEDGDIIGVHRIGDLYIHWAIYAGGGDVIHYVKDESVIEIQRTPIEDFTTGKMFALNIPLLEKESTFLKDAYDNNDTLERANSKLGEKGYSLAFNNCGDFVFWCKFGHKVTFEDQLKRSKYRIYFDY